MNHNNILNIQLKIVNKGQYVVSTATKHEEVISWLFLVLTIFINL